VKDRALMTTLLERAASLKVAALVFTVDLPTTGARYRDFRTAMSAPGGAEGALMRFWQGLTHLPWVWDVYLSGRPHHFGNLAEAMRDSAAHGHFAEWVAANFDPSLTWDAIAWIRERWKGPLLVKGVLDAEDAEEAVRAGVDGIVVSNHGGRQLDGALSSIRAL